MQSEDILPFLTSLRGLVGLDFGLESGLGLRLEDVAGWCKVSLSNIKNVFLLGCKWILGFYARCE